MNYYIEKKIINCFTGMAWLSNRNKPNDTCKQIILKFSSNKSKKKHEFQLFKTTDTRNLFTYTIFNFLHDNYNSLCV